MYFSFWWMLNWQQYLDHQRIWRILRDILSILQKIFCFLETSFVNVMQEVRCLNTDIPFPNFPNTPKKKNCYQLLTIKRCNLFYLFKQWYVLATCFEVLLLIEKLCIVLRCRKNLQVLAPYIQSYNSELSLLTILDHQHLHNEARLGNTPK